MDENDCRSSMLKTERNSLIGTAEAEIDPAVENNGKSERTKLRIQCY